VVDIAPALPHAAELHFANDVGVQSYTQRRTRQSKGHSVEQITLIDDWFETVDELGI